MMRPEHEALIHRAIDGTLTEDEREAYRRLMAESAEAQNRAAELEQLTELIESLGQADAPERLAGDVIRQVSPTAQREPVSQFVPRTNPRRGVAVNKNLIFGLAAAAVVILAVITFTSYPPATDGTEATIGAAQRAQTPQIAPADVKLADQSAQELLQSETWDAIMNDPDLYASLHDAELRRLLEDPDLRRALEVDAVRRNLNDPELRRVIKDLASRRGQALTEAEIRSVKSAQARVALQNEAFANALRRNPNLAAQLLNPRVSKALSGEAIARVVRDARFEAALRNPGFAEALARIAKK
jgi:hypothetical protein